MHAIQGAMAIRRERQKRENKRNSQIRRESGKSPRPSDAGSFGELDPTLPAPPKTESSGLTAFHLGVVFILLGFLLVFSSMITNSGTSPSGSGTVGTDWGHLLGVGVGLIIVGLIMVMVNRIITAREEEELTRYVSGRLARTRSGHTLHRDLEGTTSEAHRIRRVASTRVHLPPPGGMQRTGSTRRSQRGHPAPGSTSGATTSSSTVIATKSGNHLTVSHAKSLPASAASNGSSSSTSAQNGTATSPTTGNPPNSEAVEFTTETETLLRKSDKKPALTVTKQHSRKPSKRGQKSPQEDAGKS